MNVLITIPCLSNGGTEIQTLTLARTLISCGFKVTILCYFEYDQSILTRFEKIGGVIRLLKMEREEGLFKLFFRLYKEIRFFTPDVVHVQYMAPGAIPIVAARIAGVKTVFATVHQPYTKSHGRLAKIILRTSALLSTKFIAVSKNAENSWFSTSNFFDENKPLERQPRHFTIYNSVNIENDNQFTNHSEYSAIAASLNIPSDSVIIGSVARLSYEKGIDILIEAFRILLNEYSSVHLLLIGTGKEIDKLKALVNSYGFMDKVKFYGGADWKTSMILMNAMNIVVVPSRYEGFGLTAAEAMAHGKPVIASDSFGLKEVVAHKKTGLLFANGNCSELANALKDLIWDTEKCREYGEEGKIRIKTLFNPDLFEKKIANLYSHKRK